ncbi:MAG TPA: cold shock domain-containing protein [Chitinophagaceae bacterium]|nr:cold shock domain-containing protein [Chitinophagaceae bacterium]
MAKSRETFLKKEKEKKRLKLQQEKKQKMDDRKASKRNGNNLEGMIAYLDENGNLSDTPPDPRNKKSIPVEEIQIGVPKQESSSPFSVRTGIISTFNKARGFGFISDHITRERIFFHVNAALEPLDESNTVTFQVERGPRGLNAVQIRKTTE